MEQGEQSLVVQSQGPPPSPIAIPMHPQPEPMCCALVLPSEHFILVFPFP